MPLQLLNAAVRSYLRSGVAVTCMSQCVEELVHNSIDAGAVSIAVHVNVPQYMIQVTYWVMHMFSSESFTGGWQWGGDHTGEIPLTYLHHHPLLSMPPSSCPQQCNESVSSVLILCRAVSSKSWLYILYHVCDDTRLQ